MPSSLLPVPVPETQPQPVPVPVPLKLRCLAPDLRLQEKVPELTTATTEKCDEKPQEATATVPLEARMQVGTAPQVLQEPQKKSKPCNAQKSIA